MELERKYTSTLPAPLSSRGPLCRFLRDPKFLHALISHATSRPKTAVGITKALGVDIRALSTASAEDLARQLLPLLDQPEKRERLAKSYPLSEILFRYATHLAPELHDLFMPCHVQRSKQLFLNTKSLTDEFAKRVLADAHLRPHVIVYVAAFAFLQSNEAQKICAPFMNCSAEVRAAFSSPSGAPTQQDARQNDGTAELPPRVPERALSNEQPASEVPAVRPQGGIAAADRRIPHSIASTLEALKGIEDELDKLHRERDYAHMQAPSVQHKKLLEDLNLALNPVLAEVGNGRLKLQDSVLAARNHSELRRCTQEIFEVLEETRRRAFNSAQATLFERVKAAGLTELWREQTDQTHLEQFARGLEPKLRESEARRKILSGRALSWSALLRNYPDEACDALARAIQEIVIEPQSYELVSTLAALLHESGTYHTNVNLGIMVLDAAAKLSGTGGTRSIMALVEFAFALSKPSGESPWSLLLRSARLGRSLSSGDGAVLDYLIDHGAAQPEIVRLWVNMKDIETDAEQLLLAVAERLATRSRHHIAVQALSTWVHEQSTHTRPTGNAILGKLRDLLVAEGRAAEAVLLVASAFHSGIDITRGFEEPFSNYMLDVAIRKDENARRVVEITFEDPTWLMGQPYGPLVFLYAAHRAGLKEDCVVNARYRFQNAFDDAATTFPLLFGEFFYGIAFPTFPMSGKRVSGLSQIDISNTLQIFADIEHALQKKSCYRSWGKGELYQDIFRSRLQEIRDNILLNAPAPPVRSKLAAIDPDTWIEEANRVIGESVRHPAYGLMADFIRQQIHSLRHVLEVREALGADGTEMAATLKSSVNTLAHRLMKERRENVILAPIVGRIYDAIVESLS